MRFDLTADEAIRSYSLPELLAEKLRALGDRCLPRDLYDVVNIHRRAGSGLTGEGVQGHEEKER